MVFFLSCLYHMQSQTNTFWYCVCVSKAWCILILFIHHWSTLLHLMTCYFIMMCWITLFCLETDPKTNSDHVFRGYLCKADVTVHVPECISIYNASLACGAIYLNLLTLYLKYLKYVIKHTVNRLWYYISKHIFVWQQRRSSQVYFCFEHEFCLQ